MHARTPTHSPPDVKTGRGTPRSLYSLLHLCMSLFCLLRLFVLASFGGSYSKKNILASRQPNHVKHLMSGLYDLLKYNFHSQRSPPGDPRVAHCIYFFGPNFALYFVFFSLTGISARGPQGRSGTALRPVSHFWPHMQLRFPPSSLFRKGRARTNCLLCAPP